MYRRIFEAENASLYKNAPSKSSEHFLFFIKHLTIYLFYYIMNLYFIGGGGERFIMRTFLVALFFWLMISVLFFMNIINVQAFISIMFSGFIVLCFILSAIWFSHVKGKKFEELCEADKRYLYKLMNKWHYKKAADKFPNKIRGVFIVCSVAFVFILIIWIAIFVHLLA